MRYSQLPLWRRVLIFVVTLAIVGAIYWLAAVATRAMPLWLAAVVAAALVAFAIFGIRYDNHVRRQMEADGRLPKPRRGG